MKSLILVILLGSFTAMYAVDNNNNASGGGSLDDSVLPPAKPQCPPGDAAHPGQHQKADGTWVRN